MSEVKTRRANIEDRSRIATLLARCYKNNGAQAIAQLSKLREAAPDSVEYIGSAGDKPDGYAMLTHVPFNESKVALLTYLALNPQAPDFFNPQDFLMHLAQSEGQDASALLVFGQAEDFQPVGFLPAEKLGISIKNPPEMGTALIKPLHEDLEDGAIVLPTGLI